MKNPRIVSLVPAATEIVGTSGLLHALVGVSQEGDFPPEVDRWVRDTLASAGTLYTLDETFPYFSRPGPRIVESVELLAGVLQLEVFPEFAPPRWWPDQVVRLETEPVARQA